MELINSNLIQTSSLLKLILLKGFNFFTSVPCSIQKDLIDEIILKSIESNICYVPASSEGDAVAIANGAWLSGKKSLIICQNTALTDMLSPLILISKKFKIPLLLFISLRENNREKEIFSGTDFTCSILKLVKIPYYIVSQHCTMGEISSRFDEAEQSLQKRESFIFLIKEGIFDKKSNINHNNLISYKKVDNPIKLDFKTIEKSNIFTRYEALKFIKKFFNSSNILYIANEGYTSRELFSLGDSCANFYLTPLGYITSISLGISINTSKRIIILDGDGAILMQLGNLATISSIKPKNLIHIVFDNGVYESTGGQISPASSINLDRIISGFGYQYIMESNDLIGLEKSCLATLQNLGPYFLLIKINPKVSTVQPLRIYKEDIAQRFRNHIAANLVTKN